MSIIKNFRNPWEDDNWVLQTDVLDTSVLDTDVLNNDVLKKEHGIIQEIIPNAYIFIAQGSLTSTELKRVKNEVTLIFKKNGLKVNTQITTKNDIVEKEKATFGKYDLVIGLVNDYGASIGMSRHFEHTEKNPKDNTAYIRFLTDKLLVYDNSEHINAWVQYKNARKVGNSNEINHYPVGFYVAHEFLHQMIIKAFCAVYWSDNLKNTKDYIVMGIQSDNFEVHANGELNLNTDGRLFSSRFDYSVPNERPKHSKPFKAERILSKHMDLLNFWLNPKLHFPPPPMNLYVKNL